MERQQPVSGQAGAELRALLHQRLVRTEGGTGPASERAHTQAPPTAASDCTEQVAVPRLSVPVARCTSLPQEAQVTKSWYTAREAISTRGSTVVATVATPVPTPSPPRSAPPSRQPGSTGAPPPPCARPPPPSLGATGISPKGSRLLEASAAVAQKLQGDYRTPQVPTLHEAHKLPRDYRPSSAIETRAPLFETPVEVGEGWPPKVAVEVPVEECTTARLLPAERVMTRNAAAQLYRGFSTSEVDSAALRVRKVSCGKLYEELAFLRKENMVLHRTCAELEQRANEEFSQQLADELAQLRQDNQALQNKNAELQCRIAELGKQESHDELIGSTELKLEELRQKQEAEAERNKDQLGILLHQNEKLNRELEDLRRERREQASACMEQGSTQMQALRHQNEVLTRELDELRCTLQSQTDSELEELRMQLQDSRRQNAGLSNELQELRGAHAKDVANLRDENEVLQRRQAELQQRAEQESGQLTREVEQLRTELQSGRGKCENEQLAREVEHLRAELQGAKAKCESLEERRRCASEAAQDASPCSQGRLKAVLTDRSATLEELRQAIGAAEALLGEAKREFAAKQLRERRAAFEQLHAAIDNGNEDLLVEAIALARRAEVDAEDIVKGEAKLALLRSLSEEQRAAKALHELSMECKKQAFLFAKKDDAGALQVLLEGLDENVRWQDWRDYMGRTLWRFSQEMRASRVQACLAPRLGMQPSQEPRREPKAVAEQATAAERPSEPAEAAAAVEPVVAAGPPVAVAVAGAGAVEVSGGDGLVAGDASEAQPPAEPVAPPPLSEAEEAEMKVKAFRAVVQDNTTVLLEVLQRLHMDTWSTWQNKAGKDLLTLSQERGSSGAYSVLAKALGLVQEQKRESFEEREAVWIFAQGEVQPRRATVLEDTPAEADEVLVEYWDGDEPASRVERCLVRKMWA
mmetsp:Transcript_63386/g.175698  ORF Transcript_63386/g.175698 Transcript_63386/m.175698 type:complete len:929 (+) Transcript_63386:66-2852(+)